MRQIDYVIRGFLLMLVLAVTAWFINLLLNISPALPGKNDDHLLATEQTKPVNQAGMKLFKNNCAACHAVNKDLTGPALAGVEKRITDKKLIYAWIRNPPLVASQNKYFADLRKKYGILMAPFSLTDNEIDAILEYIQQAASQPSKPAPGTIANK
jgi:mono/diheme cytochrome c family protein